MTRFPTVKHFASWLGLSPCPKKSGGKVMSSATRKVRGPAAHAFIMAGKCVGRTDTVFGEFYRKLRTKDGPMKALTAVAHKIARAVYAMLRDGAQYARESGAEREKRQRQIKEGRLARLAEKMGYRLVPVGEKETAEVATAA